MNQHAVQPAVCCPLCQDTLHSIALLRTHLTHLHSVTADCTQKLINTVRGKKDTVCIYYVDLEFLQSTILFPSKNILTPLKQNNLGYILN